MLDRVDAFIAANRVLVAAMRKASRCLRCKDHCTHLLPEERAALDEWLATRRERPATEFLCRVCGSPWPTGMSRHLHERQGHGVKGAAA